MPSGTLESMGTPSRTIETVVAAGKAALDLILPVTCAGCGQPGAPCCRTCIRTVRGEQWFAHVTGAYTLAPYRGTPRRLVLAHKERGRRDLSRPLGHALAAAVPHLPYARPDETGTWWLVPVPSRRSAARARGGSHVLALSRHCAAQLAACGTPAAVAPALWLTAGVRDAVGLNPAQRAANLEGRLRVHMRRCPPPGTPVVLLDDVVTTGATVAACVRALARTGIEVTAALTLTGA